MVELSLDTASRLDTRLKLILNILAEALPLLNCQSFLASGTENTRTTVPLSLAVASIVPVELRDKAAMGVLCAWMTFSAERETVSKRRTSPVVGAGGAGRGERGEDEEVGAGDG